MITTVLICEHPVHIYGIIYILDLINVLLDGEKK